MGSAICVYCEGLFKITQMTPFRKKDNQNGPLDWICDECIGFGYILRQKNLPLVLTM